MDDVDIESCMWGLMEKHVLTGKKLAIFSVDDAFSISSQLCRGLGFICEQKHVY